MKLTKKTTELIITKKGNLNMHYVNAAWGICICHNRLYCKRVKGTRTLDSSLKVKEMLQSQGYKFSEGNDASRGGVEGDFIKVSKVAMTFLMEIKNSLYYSNLN